MVVALSSFLVYQIEERNDGICIIILSERFLSSKFYYCLYKKRLFIFIGGMQFTWVKCLLFYQI